MDPSVKDTARVNGKVVPVTRECTVDDIVAQIKETKAAFTTPINYLMCYNEPYVKKDPKKLIDPKDAAEYYRKFIQPAAEKEGLDIVSPTTGAAPNKYKWMVDFLAACYKKKDASPPCDVNLIKKFSVHDYKCYQSYWEDNYGGPEATFQKSLVEGL